MAVDYEFRPPAATAENAQYSTFSPEACKHYGDILCDTTRDMAERFESLFTLKSFANAEAIRSISRGFADNSALLKHEVAYVLGQMRLPAAIDVLESVLLDAQQDPMVRHEAGEALGAIGQARSYSLLVAVRDDVSVPEEVRETCELAAALIDWRGRASCSFITAMHAFRAASVPVHADDSAVGGSLGRQFFEHYCSRCSPEGSEKESQQPCDPLECLVCSTSRYLTADPAPALPGCHGLTVGELEALMMDTTASLFNRYRAMFSLRNIGDAAAVAALARGFSDKSALFRHEIAYVFGQLQSPLSVSALAQVVANRSELGMVRHEAAEALGSIATPECNEILKQFCNDESDVVRESCQVGIQMWNYENSETL